MADRRHASARGGSRLSAVAVVLLVLGVVFAVLYRIEDGREHHSYNAGAQPPDAVRVTTGHQYELSTPGGITTLQEDGLPITAFSCTYTQLGTGAGPRELDLTALGADTRTVHAVATFIAPVTGQIHIACQGFQKGVFVDDADGVDADPAGLYLLLTAICLTIGAASALSVLYRRERRAGAPARRSGPGGEYGHLLAPPSDEGRDDQLN